MPSEEPGRSGGRRGRLRGGAADPVPVVFTLELIVRHADEMVLVSGVEIRRAVLLLRDGAP